MISKRSGETIEDLDIAIPKLKETIIIKGVLRYSDGNPVAEAWVKFKVTEEDEKVYVTVFTNLIQLTTEHDLYDVELTFPYPRCERAKE